MPVISQFLFDLPYLRVLNLRGNYLSSKAQGRLTTLLGGMEGVTNVMTTPEKRLLAHSGPQVKRGGLR